MKHTLSLTRWHKVVDRLSRVLSEESNKIKKTFNSTKVTAYLGENQIQQLLAETESSLQKMELVYKLQETIAAIRSGLGDANCRHGISAKLAQLECVNRKVGFLSDILDKQERSWVAIDELENVPSGRFVEHNYGRATQIEIRMLSPENLLALVEQRETLRAESFALADQVADLNRATMAFDLDEDLARLGGLV